MAGTMKLNSVVMIDIAGALSVAACLGTSFWFSFYGTGATAKTLHALNQEVRHAEDMQSRMDEAIRRKTDAGHERQDTVGESDFLPQATPVERELRQLSELARKNGLQVAGLMPLGAYQYPGIQELRYKMTTSGTFNDYVQFLDDFQQSSSWADVTFLKMASADPQVTQNKRADLTFSFYSAADKAEEESTEQ